MEIKKVMNFTVDEIEMLSKAGQVLGNVRHAIQQGEIDVLSEDAKGLLKAIDEVLDAVITRA